MQSSSPYDFNPKMFRTQWSIGLVSGFLCFVPSTVFGQGIEDAAAILADTTSIYKALAPEDHRFPKYNWDYDEGFSRTNDGLVLNEPHALEIKQSCRMLGIRFDAVRSVKVINRDQCQVVVQVKVPMRDIPKTVAELDARLKALLRSINEGCAPINVDPIVRNSGLQVQFNLSEIMPDEIRTSVSYDLGMKHVYHFRGMKEIICLKQRAYGYGWPKGEGFHDESICRNEFTATVAPKNKDRFEAMIRKVYSTMCTGAKRPKGKF